MKKLLKIFVIGNLFITGTGSVTSCSIHFKSKLTFAEVEEWNNKYKYLNDIFSEEIIKKILSLKNEQFSNQTIKKVIDADLLNNQYIDNLSLTDKEIQSLKSSTKIFLDTYLPAKYIIENISIQFNSIQLINTENDFKNHDNNFSIICKILRDEMYKHAYTTELYSKYLELLIDETKVIEIHDATEEINDLYTFNINSRFYSKWPESIIVLMEKMSDIHMIYAGPWYISRAHYYACLIKKINFLKEFHNQADLYRGLTIKWDGISNWWPIFVEI